MIRNYNGPVSRSFIRALRGMCKASVPIREDLFNALKGQMPLHIWCNLYWFGEVDLASYIETLHTEEDVQAFITKKIEEKINFLRTWYFNVIDDPFTEMLIRFIIDSGGYFPADKELTEMYGNAERVRLEALKSKNVESSPLTPLQMLMKECLELAEEVMERKRAIDPNSIKERTQDYDDYTYFQGDYVSGTLFWNRWNSCIFGTEYSVKFGCGDLERYITLKYEYDDSEVPIYIVKYYSDRHRRFNDDDEYAVRLLIDLHKDLSKQATELGFEFISEVEDYETVTL